MAFDLDPRAPLPTSLLGAARIECKQAEATLAEPTPAHIHATRKSIKRLRAWLRLLRPQLPGVHPQSSVLAWVSCSQETVRVGTVWPRVGRVWPHQRQTG